MSVVLWVSGQVDTRCEILWHCMELGDTVLLSCVGLLFLYLCLLHCMLCT